MKDRSRVTIRRFRFLPQICYMSALALGIGIAVASCAPPPADQSSTDQSQTQTQSGTDPAKVADLNGVAVSTVCDHGNRIYTSYTGEGQTSITVVPADPSCPQTQG